MLHRLQMNPQLPARVVVARGPYAAKVITSYRAHCPQVFLVCEAWEKDSKAASLAGYDNVYYVNRLDDLNEVMQAVAKIKQRIHPETTLLFDPGYDFHAESAAASAACHAAGIQFAGPPQNALDVMSSKIKSKKLAATCGVPLVPGFEILPGALSELEEKCQQLGKQVILKGDHGGGGTENYVVNMQNREELHQFLIVKNLLSADGKSVIASSKRYYAELCLPEFSHIEIQGLCEKKSGGITLESRDCSIQRRNQKIVETAPATHPATKLAQQAAEAMLPHVHALGYRGLLTFEFMAVIDDQGQPQIYFLEVNPRIQVEHTVTEALYGIDLPELKCRVTAGESADDYFDEVLQQKNHSGKGLSTAQKLALLRELSPHRFVAEVRLNAHELFQTSNGKVDVRGIQSRVQRLTGDSSIYFGIEEGSIVNSITRNANIALVVASGETQWEALRNVLKKLQSVKVDVPTNQTFLVNLLKWLDEHQIKHPNNQTVSKLDALHPPTATSSLSRYPALLFKRRNLTGYEDEPEHSLTCPFKLGRVSSYD